MIITRTIVIAVIVAILTTGLASSSPYVFAAKPDPGFMNSNKCKIFATDSPIKNTTCCWKESDGNVFCQTCTYKVGEGYSKCDDKELQLIHHQILHHHLVLQHPYKMMEL